MKQKKATEIRIYRQTDVADLLQKLESEVVGAIHQRLHSKAYDRQPAASAISDCLLDAYREFKKAKEAL